VYRYIVHLAHTVGHFADRLVWQQAPRCLSLFQFAGSRRLCVLFQCNAVSMSIRILLAALKEGVGKCYFNMSYLILGYYSSNLKKDNGLPVSSDE
jgi:hypothetical protein